MEHPCTTRRSALAMLLAAPISSAFAQPTPRLAATTRLVVGTAAGGVPDVLCRIVAEEMTRSTGRSVVVENKVGAAGLLAVNYVLGLPADGGALVLAETGSYGIAPHMTRINPFADSLKPVALLARAPIFLVASTGTGISSLPELVAYAKENPGLAYGSSGNGSSHHLAMELLKSMTGIDLVHVPYRGAAQTAMAVVSGDVKLAFLGLNTAVPQAKAGKLKILAVASGTRSALLPEVPAISETLPSYNISITLGLFGRADTPAGLVSRLNADISAAALSNSTRERLAPAGIEAVRAIESPQAYEALVRREYETYGRIVRMANLKAS